ncbi:MAG: hypothetical protein ABSE17_03020 [Candidatus Levyibacteriota bacterium]|jgi:hypothetical protein
MRLESEGQKRYRQGMGEEIAFKRLTQGGSYLLVMSGNPDIDEPPWWPVTVLDINERGIRLKIDYSDGEKPFNGQPELKLAPEALAGLHFIRPKAINKETA